MFYRRKLALTLLRLFDGKLGKLDMQKFLFLTSRLQTQPSYEFVPYHYGSYSFQAEADRKTMIKYGLLEDGDGWTLKSKSDHSRSLRKDDINAILTVKTEYGRLRNTALMKRVYQEFPFYAINSKRAETVLETTDFNLVRQTRPKCDDHCLFTMGYEGVQFERCLVALVKEDIRVLCDVRRNPISMKFGFSKKQLASACEGLGIVYEHMPELGIASEFRRELNNQSDYDELFDAYETGTLREQAASLERIRTLVQDNRRVVLVCFESCVEQCHRGRIARALETLDGWDFPIRHIAA